MGVHTYDTYIILYVCTYILEHTHTYTHVHTHAHRDTNIHTQHIHHNASATLLYM